MRNLKALSVAALAALSVVSFGQTAKYSVGGHPARQLATVESNADFETFVGKTNKISGEITFDPSKRTGSGRVTVDLASLDTGIDLRDEHLRGEAWLQTDKHANAIFETTSVRHVSGDKYRVTGKFTLKGVTKTIATDVNLKHLKESEATKKAGFKGDVIQLKTSFNIKLSDYNMTHPSIAAGKVGKTVKIALTVYATKSEA